MYIMHTVLQYTTYIFCVWVLTQEQASAAHLHSIDSLNVFFFQKYVDIFAGTLGFWLFGYAISGNTNAGVLGEDQDYIFWFFRVSGRERRGCRTPPIAENDSLERK